MTRSPAALRQLEDEAARNGAARRQQQEIVVAAQQDDGLQAGEEAFAVLAIDVEAAPPHSERDAHDVTLTTLASAARAAISAATRATTLVAAAATSGERSSPKPMSRASTRSTVTSSGKVSRNMRRPA